MSFEREKDERGTKVERGNKCLEGGSREGDERLEGES